MWHPHTCRAPPPFLPTHKKLVPPLVVTMDLWLHMPCVYVEEVTTVNISECWHNIILNVQCMICLGSKGFCHQKCHFFCSSKSAHFVKDFATNPEFCQFTMHYFSLFIKFLQKLIFSSRLPVFVISSVFRQKRNHFQPRYVTVA